MHCSDHRRNRRRTVKGHKGVSRIWGMGSMPPCRLRRRKSLHLPSPQTPPPLRKPFFACSRFLNFHPFFQGGQLTPFAPMCGRPWKDTSHEVDTDPLPISPRSFPISLPLLLPRFTHLSILLFSFPLKFVSAKAVKASHSTQRRNDRKSQKLEVTKCSWSPRSPQSWS